VRALVALLPTAQVLTCAFGVIACEKVASPSEPPPPPGTHVGWYVTTGGTAGDSGTTGSPWDLQTALSGGNGKVRPGDTVWVRQGTYRGQFVSVLSGTAGNLIVVRAYPGERATIDGLDGGPSRLETLTINGQYAIYWGLEIMQSSTGRSDPNAGTGTPLRPTGVYVNNAHDVKFINLIVHDTGHGTYTENGAYNVEIYGWIIYNGGTESTTRSDGHGIYIKNAGTSGWKIARDNVIFDQFGFGIHGYAETGQALKNLVFDGNVLFNNGTPSDYDNPNMQLGGTVIADNDTVTNNMLYFSPGVSSANGNARIGYSTTANGTAQVANNYVAGGTQVLDLGYWSNLTVASNTFLGSSLMLVQHDVNTPTTQHWSSNTHYRDPTATAWQFSGAKTFSAWQTAVGAATDAASATLPGANWVFVRPNKYESGRANIVVYNWASLSSIAVDVSTVGLASGDHYQVRNVQDIFGTPVASGTYDGSGTISIPMGGVNPPQPIGGSFQPLHKTGPLFDVFVLTRS
jgi:hypothetical protein